jgi:hypothetical protein
MDAALAAACGVGARPPPVAVVCHPTEVAAAPEFSLAKFRANPARGVVQIGAWLRRPYAIHELRLAPTSPFTRKMALKGREMDLYFPPHAAPAADSDACGCPADDPPHIRAIEAALAALVAGGSGGGGPGGGPSRPEDNAAGGGPSRPGGAARNFYVRGLLDSLRERDASVQVIEHLGNGAYDELLTCNAVFMNLVDASACNTALECLARNTPLIVNRLPALEELLGADYPGFYTTPAQADALAASMAPVTAMYRHLATKVDKKKLDIVKFVQDVEREIVYRSRQQAAARA